MKMSSLNVLSGLNGRIRINCSVDLILNISWCECLIFQTFNWILSSFPVLIMNGDITNSDVDRHHLLLQICHLCCAGALSFRTKTGN